MRIHIISASGKMPGWVDEACHEYQKRMQHHIEVNWQSVALAHRGKNTDIQTAINSEGEAILQAIPDRALPVIALDVKGKPWDTQQLAGKLAGWQMDGDNPVFLIGGPDGLSGSCLQRADLKVSLSNLTLPHPLVRIILAEQLYRAWSILNKHPYHR